MEIDNLPSITFPERRWIHSDPSSTGRAGGPECFALITGGKRITFGSNLTDIPIIPAEVP
jgi:hypothetical protein